MKDRLNIVAIGHLDHGKSTLIGRLLYDTKTIPEEKISQARRIQDGKKGLDFSLFLDSFKEERKGRFTLDTTQAIFRSKKIEYNLIDCPGHKQFIKNMLSGASQAEYAILLVSAKSNEGIEEQTKMHINLVKLLGIRKLFVAISKMDTVNYSKKRFGELKAAIKAYLRKVNFYKKSIFVPISAKEGENLVKTASCMKWYRGKPLLKILKENIKTPQCKRPKSLRILVQDISFNGEKDILWCRIERGELKVNDRIFLNLSRQKGRVKEIRSGSKTKRVSKQGECIGIIAENINLDKVSRGEVISGLYSKPIFTNKFQAGIFFLNKRYKQNTRFLLKCGLKETGCEIDLTGFREGIHKAKIFLDEAIAIENPFKTSALGRFILFDRASNIAALGVADV